MKDKLQALANLVALMQKDKPLPMDLQQTFDEIHDYIERNA